jgi:hypothetical protein
MRRLTPSQLGESRRLRGRGAPTALARMGGARADGGAARRPGDDSATRRDCALVQSGGFGAASVRAAPRGSEVSARPHNLSGQLGVYKEKNSKVPCGKFFLFETFYPFENITSYFNLRHAMPKNLLKRWCILLTSGSFWKSALHM